jgi:hypothetical protein
VVFQLVLLLHLLVLLLEFAAPDPVTPPRRRREITAISDAAAEVETARETLLVKKLLSCELQQRPR